MDTLKIEQPAPGNPNPKQRLEQQGPQSPRTRFGPTRPTHPRPAHTPPEGAVHTTQDTQQQNRNAPTPHPREAHARRRVWRRSARDKGGQSTPAARCSARDSPVAPEKEARSRHMPRPRLSAKPQRGDEAHARRRGSAATPPRPHHTKGTLGDTGPQPHPRQHRASATTLRSAARRETYTRNRRLGRHSQHRGPAATRGQAHPQHAARPATPRSAAPRAHPRLRASIAYPQHGA